MQNLQTTQQHAARLWKNKTINRHWAVITGTTALRDMSVLMCMAADCGLTPSFATTRRRGNTTPNSKPPQTHTQTETSIGHPRPAQPHPMPRAHRCVVMTCAPRQAPSTAHWGVRCKTTQTRKHPTKLKTRHTPHTLPCRAPVARSMCRNATRKPNTSTTTTTRAHDTQTEQRTGGQQHANCQNRHASHQSQTERRHPLSNDSHANACDNNNALATEPHTMTGVRVRARHPRNCAHTTTHLLRTPRRRTCHTKHNCTKRNTEIYITLVTMHKWEWSGSVGP